MDRYPSYVVSVAGALSSAEQPLTIDALVERVRGARPDTKGVRTGVYRAIKQLYQAVSIAPGLYGWLSHLLRNNTVRHPLSNEEVRRGFLLLDELEHAILFPQFFQNHRPDNRKLTIELFGDDVLQAEAAIEKRTWSLKLGEPFVKWIDDQGGQGRDDIIISVRDAVAGVYQLRLLPREGRDEAAIEQRSIAVAAAAEELVMDPRRSERAVPAWELVALLIGRGLYADPVPPDDLHLLLQRHSMLALLEGEGYTVADRRETSNMVRAPFARRNDNFDPMFWEPDDADWNRDQDGPSSGGFGNGKDDSCQDYEEYLEEHRMAGTPGAPLGHGDYHLLEAELELLIGLEQEFGYLLSEQQARVQALAERLFIDPEVLRSREQDAPDEGDFDEPPFWQN